MTINTDSEACSDLAVSLVKAQADFPDIPRSKTVTVKTERGSYDFAYAPLDAIIKATRPVLTKYDLAISQLINKSDNGTVVVTKLLHISGESLESTTPLVQIGNGPQAFGSALTYIRRYAYCAILCIQAEDDDDANAAEGHVVAPRTPAFPSTVHPPKQIVAQPKETKNVIAEPGIPFQLIRVKSVTERTGRSGAKFYELVAQDGRKMSTFNKDHASIAHLFIDNEIPVILTTSKDGKFLNFTLPEEFVKAQMPPDEPENDDGLDGFVEPVQER